MSHFQIAKTAKSISKDIDPTDTFAPDWCLIDVDPKVFAIYGITTVPAFLRSHT